MALVHNNRFVNMPTYSQDLARCMMRVSMAESLYLDYDTDATPMPTLTGRHPGDLGSASYSWLLRGIYPGADDSGFWCLWDYNFTGFIQGNYWTAQTISFFDGTSHHVYYDTRTDIDNNPQSSWLYGGNGSVYIYPCAGFLLLVGIRVSGGTAYYDYPKVFTLSTNKIEFTGWKFDVPWVNNSNMLPVFISADNGAYYIPNVWPPTNDVYKMVRFKIGSQPEKPGFRKQDSAKIPDTIGQFPQIFPAADGGFLIQSGTQNPTRTYFQKWAYGASTLTPYYSSGKFFPLGAPRHSIWMDRENKISWSGYDFADNEWNFAFPPYPFGDTTVPFTLTRNNRVSVLGVPWAWMPEDGGNFSGHNLYPCKRLNPTPTVWYKYYRTTREEITEALTPETLTGIRLVDRQLLDVRAALESHADTYGRRDNISSVPQNFRQFNPGYLPSQNIYKHAMRGGGYGIAPADVGSYWLRANELIGGNPTYDIDIGEVWNISLLIGPYDYRLKDETA